MEAGNRRYPDGGYGWVVAVSSGAILGLSTSAAKCVGQIYLNMLQTTTYTRSQLASIVVLPGILAFVFALFSTKFAELYSFKVTMFMGAVLMAVGMCLSSLVIENLFLFAFTFVIIGIGMSLCSIPASIITGLYFKRKRSIAMGLMVSVAGIHNILMPILIQWLLNTFLLRNTLIFWAGIVLQGCVFAMLIRQPTWALQQMPLKREIKQTHNPIYLILRQLLKDFRLFRKNIFILLLCSRITYFFLFHCTLLIVPAFAIEHIEGITNTQSAFLISVINIADLCSKFVGGWLNELIPKHTIMYLVAMVLLSLTMLLFQLTTSYTSVLVLCVIFGVFSGYIFFTYFLVMFDTFGPAQTPGAIALQFEVKGFCLLLSGPVIALIRNLTGSYAHCFTLFAVLLDLSVVFWVCSRVKCCNRK